MNGVLFHPMVFVKYFFKALFGYSNTRILHGYCYCIVFLRYRDKNLLGTGGIFNGIGQQVHDHLLQPVFISSYFILYCTRLYNGMGGGCKLQVFNGAIDQFIKIKLRDAVIEFAQPYLTHIQ